MQKPPLTFWQIWNMSFGFLGIQFGWGLQMANMSPIYEYLGAKPDELPILWLAAPLTGLIVQPIIGHMSDRTWGRLGRRRPYFLTGAILSSAALVLMPNSSALWMAAGLLWVLDASINVSMEPFRAYVADLLPEEQRTRGFAMQSVFIGLGAVVASALPWLMTWLGVEDSPGGGAIPRTVRLSFYIGAAAFLGAVLWTVLSSREYPPEDMEAFRRLKAEGGSGLERLLALLREILRGIAEMPRTMRQLAAVQFFTWLGLFCMWLFFGVAVARDVLGAPDEKSPLFKEGTEWGGLCFAFYSLVCFGFSFVLPWIARAWGRKRTHCLCLLCGAAGLLSVAVIGEKHLLLLSMAGVGIAWASIVSMPYAILSGSIPPARTGLYMGIFNFFIVIPEICASLGLGWVMEHVLGQSRVAGVVAGGGSLVVAALLTLRVRDAAEKGAT
ncbi:MAG: MFS transporter [Planctomycetes bacterium]|nr:MFS transporter [Planctomycetota bacterium]